MNNVDKNSPAAATLSKRGTASLEEEAAAREIWQVMHSHWALFLVQGVTMVALGVAAVIEPMAATFDVELFVGWLFLAAGIVGLCGIGLGRRIFGFWWEVMAALLAIAIGGYLVWRPLNGVIPLSIVAAVFFAAQGLTQIIVAMSHRAVLASWVWVLLSSIVNFGLAVIVFSGSPNIAAWTLGLAFGINLIMWGAALIAIAIASRAASSPK